MESLEEKQFIITDILYAGKGCKVYKSKENNLNNKSDHDKCIKKYLFSYDKGSQNYLKAVNELRIYLKISNRHNNIISLEKYNIDDSSIILIFPYSSYGDLQTFLQRNSLNKREKRELIYNIIKAINFLHENKIIHGDIKLENILIFQENGRLIPKICDFNNSLINDESDFSNIMMSINREFSSTRTTPPEILFQTENYSYSSDMWNLGVLIFNIIYTEYPFDYFSIHKLSDFENKEYKRLFYCNPEVLNDFIENLLDVNCKLRINSTDALNHPYFKNLNKSVKSNIKLIRINRRKFIVRLIKRSDSYLKFSVDDHKVKNESKFFNLRRCFITMIRLDNCLYNSLHEPSPLNSYTNTLFSSLRSPIRYETRLNQYVSPISYSNYINGQKLFSEINKSNKNIKEIKLNSESCILISLKTKIKLKVKFSKSIIIDYFISNMSVSYTKMDKIMMLRRSPSLFTKLFEENINFIFGKKLYLQIHFRNKKNCEKQLFSLKIISINLDSCLMEKIVSSFSNSNEDRLWKGELIYLIKINKVK